MYTTLNAIRSHSPCSEGWTKLLRTLNKTCADNEPVSIIQILDSNGLDDALWCFRAVKGYDKEIRLYAVWCARQVEHLMTDQRSKNALDVAERFAHGNASQEGLDDAAWGAAAAASDAAGYAAWGAAGYAAWGAAGDAGDAAWGAAAAAWGAAGDAAWGAAGDAAAAASDAAGYAAWGAAGDAAWGAAGDAAWGAAWGAQEKELRRVCARIEAKEEAYE